MSAAEAARRPARRRRARGAADSQGQRHAESSAQAPCALAGAPHCASTAASVRAQRVLLPQTPAARPQPAAARSPQVARGRTRQPCSPTLSLSHTSQHELYRALPPSQLAHTRSPSKVSLSPWIVARSSLSSWLSSADKSGKEALSLSLFLYRICACFSSLVGRRKTGAASACLCLACRLGRVAHV